MSAGNCISTKAGADDYRRLVAVAAGIATVLGHNVWSGGAVTVIGWVLTFKGTVLLFAPSALLRKYCDALGLGRWFGAYLTAIVLFGCWLVWASLFG